MQRYGIGFRMRSLLFFSLKNIGYSHSPFSLLLFLLLLLLGLGFSKFIGLPMLAEAGVSGFTNKELMCPIGLFADSISELG